MTDTDVFRPRLLAKAVFLSGVLLAAAVWTPLPALADPPFWAPAYGYRSQFPDIAVGTCDRSLVNSEVLGTVAGAALGGFLGSKIGKGSGQLAATAAGTLLGAVAGNTVGRAMDAADRACLERSLEAAPDNETVAWHNPDANAAYQVTPVRSYDNAGRYCREYITEVTIGGEVQQAYGTACRQPDGAWEVVS